MLETVQNYIRGRGAVNIAGGIEQAVREGRLMSGQRLPTVRDLAAALRVSPTTVAAAYRSLQSRGVIVSQGRRGTRIAHRPVMQTARTATPPPNARILWDGNPDPALLPSMRAALAAIDPAPRLYGGELHHQPFIDLVARQMHECGVQVGELCVVNGAMDGIERVFAERLKPGDKVIVEDPGFRNIYELAMSRGLLLVPVSLDDAGILPESLERACAGGADALVLIPRAQNPTGAAMTAERAAELLSILDRYPDLLIIEDDHAGWILDCPLYGLHQGRRRFAHIRSLSKAFNPDFRLAVMTGDDLTMRRVLDRLLVGERWVSHILQRAAAAMLSDPDVLRSLRTAAEVYARRLAALVDALRDNGFEPTGRCGYNVWVPLPEEAPAVAGLLARGWAVAAGERFRLNSPPAIRITAATLEPHEAVRLAADLAECLAPSRTCAAV
ncbi:MAG: aminotransferase class I/II-fold pyridoxal phosphate-dependent enzyme [Phycisphaerales bacterium]|nr:MAG: aminotransferase class I/II-fold pyridoxal phosphate-dependent enzyme [Phycisphaerales bacterium]